MTYGLSADVLRKIRAVFAQYPQIEQVILYGSRAKGNFRKGSDIDLTIKGEGVSLSQLLKIESQLDDLLLPHKIDLSLFHQLEDPDLVAHIARVGVILYQPST